MSDVYIVAWTGGYERPQYASTTSRKAAQVQASDWAADADADSDTIQIIRVASRNGAMIDVEDIL